jgi:uncharacterized phiE125 gp8 family phage protein
MTKPALDYYEVVQPEPGEGQGHGHGHGSSGTPIALVVSLEEFKEFAKLDPDDDSQDVLLTEFICAATEDLERYTNRWFIEREAIGYYVGLELSQFENYPYAEIQHSPLLDVSEVAQWVNGSYQPITNYKLKQRDGYARVLFPNSGIVTNIDEPYPYRITFEAGYGDADAVPAAIKLAVKMYAAYLYENRGDCECGPEARQASGAKTLVARYRISRTF